MLTIYNATAYGEAIVGSTTPTGEVRMFHFSEGDTLTQV